MGRRFMVLRTLYFACSLLTASCEYSTQELTHNNQELGSVTKARDDSGSGNAKDTNTPESKNPVSSTELTSPRNRRNSGSAEEPDRHRNALGSAVSYNDQMLRNFFQSQPKNPLNYAQSYLFVNLLRPLGRRPTRYSDWDTHSVMHFGKRSVDGQENPSPSDKPPSGGQEEIADLGMNEPLEGNGLVDDSMQYSNGRVYGNAAGGSEKEKLQDGLDLQKKSELPWNDHNTMHFGKRENEPWHDMMSFGKRENEPWHDMMSFGKRENEPWHDMMSFGKRENEPWHDMMSFGKRENEPWHDMMSFGKRENEPWHDMMSFGKRENEPWHDMMSFGKRFEDPSYEHNTLHFGKRDEPWHDMMSFGKRPDEFWNDHNTMHFGKRDNDELDGIMRYLRNASDYLKYKEILESQITADPSSKPLSTGNSDSSIAINKRSLDHNTMHFGKKSWEAHNTMHFGKKSDDSDSHNMMYFGKKSSPWDAHNTLHFGKKSWDDHSTLHFGKKSWDNHDTLHFGKRPWDDHNTLHFGKKSWDDHNTLHFGKKSFDDHNTMHFGKKRSEEGDEGKEPNGPDLKNSESNIDSSHYPNEDTSASSSKAKSLTKRSLNVKEENGMDKIKDVKKPSNESKQSESEFKSKNAPKKHKRQKSNAKHMVTPSNGKIEGKRYKRSIEDETKVLNQNERSNNLEQNAMENKITRLKKRSIDNKESENEIAESPESGIDKRFDSWHDHSTLHFGKKYDPWQAHNTMHFGKKSYPMMDHNTLHFGKKWDEWNGHDTLHFGKKSDPWELHNTMHFGKRSDPWDSHHTMHFGKKSDPWNSHHTMHFGKKSDPWDSHHTMHFGKKSDPWDSHHTMHFGKKSDSWNSHNTMHFGKKSDPWENHSTMHFGKRSDPWDNHNTMHFGKRSDPWDSHSTLHFGKKSDSWENEMNSGKGDSSVANLYDPAMFLDYGSQSGTSELGNVLKDWYSGNPEGVLRLFYPSIYSGFQENPNEAAAEDFQKETKLAGVDDDSNSMPEDTDQSSDDIRLPSFENVQGYSQDSEKMKRSEDSLDFLKPADTKRYMVPFQGARSIVFPHAWFASQIRRSSIPKTMVATRSYAAKSEEKKEDPVNSYMHFGRR